VVNIPRNYHRFLVPSNASAIIVARRIRFPYYVEGHAVGTRRNRAPARRPASVGTVFFVVLMSVSEAQREGNAIPAGKSVTLFLIEGEPDGRMLDEPGKSNSGATLGWGVSGFGTSSLTGEIPTDRLENKRDHELARTKQIFAPTLCFTCCPSGCLQGNRDREYNRPRFYPMLGLWFSEQNRKQPAKRSSGS